MLHKQFIKAAKSVAPYATTSKARIHTIPYYAQWESSELVKEIIQRRINAEDDPAWQKSGATTKAEYALWSWNGCGMACTKMMLAHATGKNIPLVDLGKQALSYGAYKEPLDSSPGLYYKPYVTFLHKEFGLKARSSSTLTLQEIVRALSEDKYIIASVSPEIREPNKIPRQKGGHLVLVVGYDLTKKELYLHNPSGLPQRSQGFAPIYFNDFKRFFSGKGIISFKVRKS